MTIWPQKCSDLATLVLGFSNILINGSNIEVVNHVKILSFTISGDLKWNQHVDNIVKKANKRIYFIIQLKRAKIPPSAILLFYCTCVNPILEYSTQVFHYALPKYLSDVIERVQQRVVSIINPGSDYTDSLTRSKLQTLHARREDACLKLFKNIESRSNHKLHHLPPTRMVQNHCLRSHREFIIPNVNTNRFLNTFILSSVNEMNKSQK